MSTRVHGIEKVGNEWRRLYGSFAEKDGHIRRTTLQGSKEPKSKREHRGR